MAASPYVWGTRTKILCKYADGRECKLYLGHLTKPENVQSAQVWRGRSSATNWPMRTERDCPTWHCPSPHPVRPISGPGRRMSFGRCECHRPALVRRGQPRNKRKRTRSTVATRAAPSLLGGQGLRGFPSLVMTDACGPKVTGSFHTRMLTRQLLVSDSFNAAIRQAGLEPADPRAAPSHLVPKRAAPLTI